MPYIPRITKTTTDVFSVVFNYNGWEQLLEDDLSTAVVSAAPSGLTLGTPSVNSTTEKVTVSVSGGSDGTTYLMTCLATTDAGDVLTGYLNLVVSNSATDGVVVYPSQLLPYFDNNRAMELLYDKRDLADTEDVPDSETIDGNSRAFALTQASWRTVLEAATRGKIYSLQELTDYASDPIRGADLIELVANLFWCRLVKRRRYTAGEPQAEESACKDAEERLQLLREGERIFDLEGVVMSSGGGVYGNAVGEATALSIGRYDNNCDDGAGRFWACTNRRPKTDVWPRRNQGGCC